MLSIKQNQYQISNFKLGIAQGQDMKSRVLERYSHSDRWMICGDWYEFLEISVSRSIL